MYKTYIQRSEIKVVGITCRTNNLDEASPSTAKIALIVQEYIQQSLAENIKSRKKPGVTFSVYTNYDSDFTGDYTYFIGEEVTAFNEIQDGFEKLVIPVQEYVKFTGGSGSMPNVCIDMWQKIWQMNEFDLGGKRAYIADFEIYDERALDYKNTVLDIYVGIDKYSQSI